MMVGDGGQWGGGVGGGGELVFLGREGGDVGVKTLGRGEMV